MLPKPRDISIRLRAAIHELAHSTLPILVETGKQPPRVQDTNHGKRIVVGVEWIKARMKFM